MSKIQDNEELATAVQEFLNRRFVSGSPLRVDGWGGKATKARLAAFDKTLESLIPPRGKTAEKLEADSFGIGPDGWLAGVERDEIPGGSTIVPLALVIHFTAGATGRSSINYWRTPAAKGASAHIVIERDGTVIQCRPFNKSCGHAGKRGDHRWKDPRDGRVIDNMNSHSIGIELANAGDAKFDWNKSEREFVRLAHRNGGVARDWEKFPEPQMLACIALSRVLVDRYNLRDVTGHDCIAPARKNDPGPAFDFPRLREACGFGRTLPVVHRA